VNQLFDKPIVNLDECMQKIKNKDP